MLTFLIYNVFVFQNIIWISSLVDFAPQNSSILFFNRYLDTLFVIR